MGALDEPKFVVGLVVEALVGACGGTGASIAAIKQHRRQGPCAMMG
jgi:hypothetical protein